MSEVKSRPAVSIQYQPSDSSQISAWGYDAATQTLGIKFKTGGTYHYFGVPPDAIDRMHGAKSLGSFHGKEIRGVYAYERQPDDDTGIVFGLSQKQEPKYTVSRHGRLTNRATGKPIPDDEPVFVLRAKDKHAIAALQHYLSCCTQPDHKAVVRSRIIDFTVFADEHSDRMHEPDSHLHDVAGANVGRAPFSQSA